jgi:hypothetical protein
MLSPGWSFRRFLDKRIEPFKEWAVALVAPYEEAEAAAGYGVDEYTDAMEAEVKEILEHLLHLPYKPMHEPMVINLAMTLDIVPHFARFLRVMVPVIASSLGKDDANFANSEFGEHYFVWSKERIALFLEC